MQKRNTRRADVGKEPIEAALLAWYDRERRVLPWRAAPGERPDPYKVWLSEIMLQQTTVKAVLPRYALFFAAGLMSPRWPAPSSARCSPPGPDSAITPGREISMPAPAW